MGLIFDTTEFIAAERSHRSIGDVIASFDSQEEIGISVVTVAELQHGVRRAQGHRQLERRRLLLEDALSVFKVHPFTRVIAMRVGDLDAELAMQGKRTDFADLVIAATALDLNFALVTNNTRHFTRIPDLRILPSSL
ncbi:MAG: PIN domain-containing protein [Acidobacteriaceae bacterium]